MRVFILRLGSNTTNYASKGRVNRQPFKRVTITTLFFSPSAEIIARKRVIIFRRIMTPVHVEKYRKRFLNQKWVKISNRPRRLYDWLLRLCNFYKGQFGCSIVHSFTFYSPKIASQRFFNLKAIRDAWEMSCWIWSCTELVLSPFWVRRHFFIGK